MIYPNSLNPDSGSVRPFKTDSDSADNLTSNSHHLNEFKKTSNRVLQSQPALNNFHFLNFFNMFKGMLIHYVYSKHVFHQETKCILLFNFLSFYLSKDRQIFLETTIKQTDAKNRVQELLVEVLEITFSFRLG